MKILAKLLLLATLTLQEEQQEYQPEPETTADLAQKIDELTNQNTYYKNRIEEYENSLIGLELLTTELATAKAHLALSYNSHGKNLLEAVLIQRLITPVDAFLFNAAAPSAKADIYNPATSKKEFWYAYVIEPDSKLKDTSIWIKFSLSESEYQITPGFWKDYCNMKKKGLIATLERHLILMIDDPDMIDTMINGTPHLYRLVTKEMPIERLRKEDLLY